MATPQSMSNGTPAPVLDTQLPDQYFSKGHYSQDSEGQSPSLNGSLMTPSASIPPTPGSLAGRKRSRGDIFANDEDLEPDGSLPTPEQESFADGLSNASQNGMNLTHPHSIDQMEVIMEAEPRPQHVSRPSISSRKSQRIDTSSADEDHLAQLLLPNDMREATTPPLIDEATRALGISWTRMDSSEALSISQAAYSKFIQKHYPSLKDVSVWFENSALPGYLVQASNAFTGQQGYYLFSHDLLEARLVTREPADLLPRLQLLPRIELAAPGGHMRAETDAATVSQNEVNNVLEAAVEAPSQKAEDAQVFRGRSAEPAYRYRELLCTAHEMELD